MNKPVRAFARPLAEFLAPCLGDVFARQGFAAGELVRHWPDIVGGEIAALAEPTKLQWPRRDAALARASSHAAEPEAATLVLRVEGPAAIEVQHLSGVIIERVNRFLGYRAVGRLALRQAPLPRRRSRAARPRIDAARAEAVAGTLTRVADEPLRAALGRLGAAVKGS